MPKGLINLILLNAQGLRVIEEQWCELIELIKRMHLWKARLLNPAKLRSNRYTVGNKDHCFM